jgi:hypothetical protein
MATPIDHPEPSCSATTLPKVGPFHPVEGMFRATISFEPSTLFDGLHNSPRRARPEGRSTLSKLNVDTEMRPTNVDADLVNGYVPARGVSGGYAAEPASRRESTTPARYSAAGQMPRYGTSVDATSGVTSAIELSEIVQLAEAEIDAVSGGHGHRSGGFGGLSVTINLDPIIAIGDVFVNGNVTTGNATGNNANSSLAIGAGLFKNIRVF